MKIKNFMKYFKEEVLKYFEIFIMHPYIQVVTWPGIE